MNKVKSVLLGSRHCHQGLRDKRGTMRALSEGVHYNEDTGAVLTNPFPGEAGENTRGDTVVTGSQ